MRRASAPREAACSQPRMYVNSASVWQLKPPVPDVAAAPHETVNLFRPRQRVESSRPDDERPSARSSRKRASFWSFVLKPAQTINYPLPKQFRLSKPCDKGSTMPTRSGSEHVVLRARRAS